MVRVYLAQFGEKMWISLGKFSNEIFLIRSYFYTRKALIYIYSDCWIKPVITLDIVTHNAFIDWITLEIMLGMLDPMNFMLLARFFSLVC